MAAEQYEQFLTVAVDAAKVAGSLISDAFAKPKNVDFKGKVDLVTETDKECEKVIIQHIKGAFPDHKFIGEESSAEQGFTSQLTDDPTWMIDPLDGTTNFVHRYPFVCTCIGLAVRKQVVAGVVYNPILNELFTATRGGGAFVNDQPIRTSDQTDVGSALLATEIGVARDDETMSAIFGRLKLLCTKSRSVRCSGSCALNLCSVACGRIDAFFEIGFGGPWDVAGASVILQEAGGQILDPAGGSFDLMARRVLGTNGHLGKAYAELLAAAPLGSREPPPP